MGFKYSRLNEMFILNRTLMYYFEIDQNETNNIGIMKYNYSNISISNIM